MLTAAVTSSAQTEHRDDFDTFVELLADLADDEAEEEWGSELMEDLYELYCHPLNLNDLHEEQLTELPFLTNLQIGDLIDYADRHQPVVSTGELMSITSLDYTTRRLLQLFLYAGPLPQKKLTLKNLLAHSDHELTLRSDIPLYTRMGFADYPASVLSANPNKVYLGSQPYLSARYTLEAMGRIEAGFQLEKDAGESGVDYWAAYALLRRTGPVDVLAVGDYRISFGMGLVVNTASGFGKTMMLSSISRMDRGIRRHSGMAESGYMSGVASTVRLGSRMRLSAFFSHRNTDGTLTEDGSAITSVRTDGMHRTQSEQRRKGNLRKTDFGGNISWQGEHLRLSATAVHTRYSLPLQPRHDTAASLYRLYNVSGSDFTAFSLAYRYIARQFTLSGETASTAQGGVGSLLAFQSELGGHQLTLIGRYYSPDFVSINGKTFGNNSHPQNESGIYVGWQRQLSRVLRAEAYADYMYFPWLKYQVSKPSNALELMAQLSYTPTAGQLVSLRYRTKSQQRDWKVDGTLHHELILHTTHTARLMHVWDVVPQLRLKSMLNGSLSHRPDKGNSIGWSLSENVSWKPFAWMQTSLAVTYFHTDDYSSRIYLYEPSLLYTFGMSAVYDQGLRAALLATIHPWKGVDITAKIGHTHMFQNPTIGTGLDLIPSSHREDLQLQLRWSF